MSTDEQAIGGWLSELAARQATPGGGSAAALSAAIAAGLAGMVAAYTTGAKWSDREAHMQEVAAELADIRRRAIAAADDDVAVFGAVSAAYGLPRQTEQEKASRSQAIQRALVAAAGPPADVGRLASRVIQIAQDLAEAGNPSVLSDVAVAVALGQAAIEGAIVNIDVNRQQIKDEAEKHRLASTVGELESVIVTAGTTMRAIRGKLRS